MKQISQQTINDAAWKACDTFRGVVDPGQYKDYILIFLFWKYISDLWADHNRTFSKQYGNDSQRIRRRLERERFVLPKGTSFQDLYNVRKSDNIGELINIALEKIESANKAKLEGVLTGVDFNSTNNLGETADRNRRLRNLFDDFSAKDLDFRPSRFDGEAQAEDAIGETYIYLISQFASDAGKKAGEFFTPRKVSELLVRLVDPEPGSRICDPACGSGTLLIRAAEEIARKERVDLGRANVKLFGQESIRQTQALARMNMFLHGLDNARIEWADTLNSPKLVESDALMRFDIVVANPPFSLDKWGEENARSDRFRRFHRGIPPKSRGDFAFISHMIESAKPREGRVAVVAPHAVLFRVGSEGRIRQALVDENILDAVVGLPAQLFPTTRKAVCLLVFDRAREKGGSRASASDVMFIDASREFVIGKGQNQLTAEHLDRIREVWRARKDVKGYAAVVPCSVLKEKQYDLNIPLYVDTFEPEDMVDVKTLQTGIKSLSVELAAIKSDFDFALAELPSDSEPSARYEEVKLSKLLAVRGETSSGTESVFSVSVHKGLVDQIAHLGRSYAAANTDNYKLVKPGDVVYTKSPTGEFPLGVVKQSRINHDAIVSPLYAVYEPVSYDVGVIIDAFFSDPIRSLRYLTPLVHRGAKNTISVTDAQFLEGTIRIPKSKPDRAALAKAILKIRNGSQRASRVVLMVQKLDNSLIGKLLRG